VIQVQDQVEIGHAAHVTLAEASDRTLNATPLHQGGPEDDSNDSCHDYNGPARRAHKHLNTLHTIYITGIYLCASWHTNVSMVWHLSCSCEPVATVDGRPQLHSSDDHQLLVPRTRTVTFGPRAFYTSGPTAWNAPPATLRDPTVTLGRFRQKKFIPGKLMDVVDFMSLRTPL